MIAVIFEFWPKAAHRQTYLDIAAGLQQHLQEIEGFIGIERFQSLTDETKILSLSFFEDEAAVQRWRNLSAHRAAQAKGRGELFADYRLRVAGVIRDYSLSNRDQAPDDSRAVHQE